MKEGDSSTLGGGGGLGGAECRGEKDGTCDVRQRECEDVQVFFALLSFICCVISKGCVWGG